MSFTRQISTVDLPSPSVHVPISPSDLPKRPIYKGNTNYNCDACDSFIDDVGSQTALHPKGKVAVNRNVPWSLLVGGFVVLVLVNLLLAFGASKIFQSDKEGTDLCLPCGSLVLGDDLLDDYREYFYQSGFADGNPVCCAKSMEQFEIMMEVVSV